MEVLNLSRKSFESALSSTVIIFFLCAIFFPMFEAGVTLAAGSQTVATRQQVTAEISMTVNSGSISLTPPIPGLTGGTGDGSTTVNVITNSDSGYLVTILASTTGVGGALAGDSKGGSFSDYVPSSPGVAEPWSSSGANGASQFGFGISNNSLSGSGNQASGYGTCSVDNTSCYDKAPTTTTKQIVNVTTFTPATGDTFTLKFKAHIPANTSRLIPEDWYTCTTTVTATVQ